MRRRAKRAARVLCALLLALCVGGAAYLSDYYRADEAAVAAMAAQSDAVYTEQRGDVTWFVPTESIAAGLIFYPGGKVEAAAYAPLLRAFAAQGILCALVEMPAHLAVLDADAADGLREAFPSVADWYIAGHSLGGAMAARYAASHAGELAGLILLAAYSTSDLSTSGLRVLSVLASEDGVLDAEAYAANRANLPADAVEVALQGACHAQFGSYGAQKADGQPTITGDVQVERTAEAVGRFVMGQASEVNILY